MFTSFLREKNWICNKEDLPEWQHVLVQQEESTQKKKTCLFKALVSHGTYVGGGAGLIKLALGGAPLHNTFSISCAYTKSV